MADPQSDSSSTLFRIKLEFGINKNTGLLTRYLKRFILLVPQGIVGKKSTFLSPDVVHLNGVVNINFTVFYERQYSDACF